MNKLISSSLAAVTLVASASVAPGATLIYNAILNGPSESPVNASPGTGFATVTIDDINLIMRVQATFSGLTGTTTASHIHAATPSPLAGTAGVATTTPTFAGFPLGVTSGVFDSTLDMRLASSYNPAYVTANGNTPASAFAALDQAIIAGEAYLNIHTSTFGGGEIRGFLIPAPVPEPTSIGLIALGCTLGLARRQRK
jgi:hypothetical protein